MKTNIMPVKESGKKDDNGKRKASDGGKRKNAVYRYHTMKVLPGYNKTLPPQAQELVEKAILDHNLAEASMDDPRWVELYQELHRLVQQPTDSDSSMSTGSTMPSSRNEVDNDDDERALDSYTWASPSPSPPASHPSSPQPNSSVPDHRQSFASLLPDPFTTTAVHRHISSSLTNPTTNPRIRTGSFINDIQPESWDPSSLVAMSILVEEIAKSQAQFNAQRTMFAKSPRNQALAAARAAKKRKKEHTEEHKEQEE